MKKNMKKVLAIVLAVVLIVGATIGATLAWLTAQTEKVTNTFTSAKLFAEPENDFTLWEHEATDEDKDGAYELNNQKEVTSNTYKILPGVDIPKDPTVDVVELQECGYLYITVATNSLPTGVTYSIDSNEWEVLSGYSGVWVYKGSQAVNNVISASVNAKKSFTVNILTDKEVLVADDYTPVANPGTLTFNAYMVQATGNGANAAEAWANTYGATT